MKEYRYFETRFGKLIRLSFGEEIGNAVSHGVVAVILLCLLPYVAVRGYVNGGALLSIGYSIFVISLFFMFLMSCLYHSMRFNTYEKFYFRILDHSAIFVAIAGTFTPICLSVISAPLGIVILVIQWLSVLFGILYKSLSMNKMPKASLVIYLMMGWSGLLLIPQMVKSQNWVLIALIALGGILYSVGTIFYSQKTKPWAHFIWHIFIILASISHFIAIIYFI